MANNKRISELNPLNAAASNDIFAIVHISISETMKISKAGLMGTPGPIGANTPDTAAFTQISMGGVPINEFSTDGTLSGDSDTAVPTEKAVKSYVDAAVANAVKLSVIHTSTDSTAVIGDVYIAHTDGGDVTIELVPTGNVGKIIVYRDGSNQVDVNPASGSQLDGDVLGTSITVDTGSLEFLCDGTDFYTI